MAEFVMTLSLLVSLFAYALVAWREQSWLNIFTPSYIVLIPSHWLLEFYLTYVDGTTHSIFAYVYVYFTYAAVHLVSALAYCFFKTPVPALSNLRNTPRNFKLLPICLVAAAWALYSPMLYEYHDLLLSPRLIYTQTRTGYGIPFYGSLALSNVGFALVLLWRNRPRGLAALVFITSVVFAALHGAKGAVLTPIFIGLIFRVSVKENRRKYGITWLTVYAGGVVIALLILFALTLNSRRVVEWESLSELMITIAEYANYNQNVMLVIDSSQEPLWGRVTVENSVYTMLPRTLFPDKPKNFGSFQLDENFYPAWFYGGTGVPDFGIGVQYADFGALAVVYLALWAALTGCLLRVFVDRFRAGRLPGDFIMLLFLAGVEMFSVPPGYMLLQHYALALSLNLALRLHLDLRLHIARSLSYE
jgi:oligosaccharide repeat unit polymerase